jgi:16S rRNA processing protein RimM
MSGPAAGDVDATSVEVAVGRVLRAHGVRGRLVVLPLTDEPADRLTSGTVLTVEAPTRPRAPRSAPAPTGPGPAAGALPRRLTVVRAVADGDRFLVRVEEISDRDTAEALKGSVLLTEVPAGRRPADPEEFYDHQLVGLAAHDRSGDRLGTVTAVDHRGAQDLLVVAGSAGVEVLVPFVAALVPEVDLARGRVVLTPPPGLFDELPTP